MPVLAICRGLQLVNVARGGTLHQHLPEALGTERYRVGGGVFAIEHVERRRRTRRSPSSSATGDLDVHSYHHQGHRPARRRARRDGAHRRRTRAGVRVHRRRATSSGCSGTPSRTSRTAGSSPDSWPRHPACRIALRRFAPLRSERHERHVHRSSIPSTGGAAPRGAAGERSARSMPRSHAPCRHSVRWAALAPVARADALRAFARVVEAHVEELAQLEVLQLGASDQLGPVGGIARRPGAELLRGCARAAGRTADPGRRRTRRHVPRAVRRGGHHRAVELPDDDRRRGASLPRSPRATRSCSSPPS